MQEESINDMPFQRRYAPAILRAAVEQLSERRGAPVEEMEHLPLGQIARLALETYGSELPEYWRVWHDWQQHGHAQPTGDL